MYGVPVLFGLVLGITLVLFCVEGSGRKSTKAKLYFQTAAAESFIISAVQFLLMWSATYPFDKFTAVDFSLPFVATATFIAGLIVVCVLEKRNKTNRSK